VVTKFQWLGLANLTYLHQAMGGSLALRTSGASSRRCEVRQTGRRTRQAQRADHPTGKITDRAGDAADTLLKLPSTAYPCGSRSQFLLPGPPGWSRSAA
jgi:hypothetical protein